MRGIGTIANVIAVIIGSAIGMLLKGGLPQRFQDILNQALGLCVMFLGVAGTMQEMLTITDGQLVSGGTMLMIASLVIGSVIGEMINIEYWMEEFGKWLKEHAKGKNEPKFVEGFVTASLVICVGAMAIIGSIQDGLFQDPSILYAKAILDAVIVMIFASTYGKGVMFSAIPVGILQGSVTILAQFLAPFLTEQMTADISFVGSILIFCVGINLCFGKRFKVANMLPAVIIAAVTSGYFG